MAAFRFNLELATPKKPKSRVVLVTFINKKKMKYSLPDVTVDPKTWVPKSKGRLAQIDTGFDTALLAKQQRIDEEVSKVREAVANLAFNKVTLSAEALRAALKPKTAKVHESMSFCMYVDNFMQRLEDGKRFGKSGKTLGEGTKKRYHVTKKLLDAYRTEKLRGRRIKFADVDADFINDWKRWRADGKTIGRKVVRKPVSVNTLNNDLKILKVWLKSSYLDNLHNNRIWQRDEMRKTVVVPIRPRLTVDELKLVENATFDHLRKGNQGPRSSAHNQVRDMFLLACWTAARIGDVKRFPDLVKTLWDDNKGACPDVIEIIQSKTNTPAFIPIAPPARRIIERYNGQLPTLPNSQKCNSVLKEVIEAAGITRSFQRPSTSIDGGEPEMVRVCDTISFHDARRTALTNFYLLDVLSMPQLMKISGHSTETQFIQYLDIDGQKMLDEGRERFLAATAHL